MRTGPCFDSLFGLVLIAGCLGATSPLAEALEPKSGTAEQPLFYDGPGLADPLRPDGALMFSPGVQNIQLSRANRKPSASFPTPEKDQPGYTYQHHIDLGCWKG